MAAAKGSKKDADRAPAARTTKPKPKPKPKPTVLSFEKSTTSLNPGRAVKPLTQVSRDISVIRVSLKLALH